MHKSIRIACFALSILVSAAGLFGGLLLAYRNAKAKTPPVPRTAIVTRGNITVTVPGTGTLRAAVSEPIYTRIDGRIAQFYHQSGDVVHAGEPFALLESETLSAALQQAADHVAAQTALLSEQALQTASTLLRAPISGCIKSLPVQPGDLLETLAGPLVVLSNQDLRLSLTLPDSMSCNVGDSYALTIRGKQATGVVESVTGKDVTLRIADNGYFPGESAILYDTLGQFIATGTLTLVQPVALAGLTGVVEEVFAAVGNDVVAGDPLLVLRDTRITPALQLQWNVQQEAVETLAQAREKVSLLTLTAPTDGVLEIDTLQIGQSVAVNTRVAHVTRADPYVASLFVHEEHIARIYAGQTALLHVPALPDETFRGTIARILPQSTQHDDGTYYTLELPLSACDGMREGMHVVGEIAIDGRTDALLLPADALYFQENQYYALRVPDPPTLDALARIPSAQWPQAFPQTLCPVETGLSVGGLVEILHGLSEGDIVLQWD